MQIEQENKSNGYYLYDSNNHYGLFYILMLYAQNSTFKNIYRFISNNFGLDLPEFYYDINDYRYFLFWLLTCDNQYLKEDLNTMHIVLINLLKSIIFIEEHFSLFEGLSSKQLTTKTEDLISLILENNELISWTNITHQNRELHYFKLQNLTDIDFDPNTEYKSYKIYNDKYFTYLEKIKIVDIRQISDRLGIDRFKTMYKSFSKALIEQKNGSYCAWCNPDTELLRGKKRPRVNDECRQIWNFIVKYSDKYTDKSLNEHITHMKNEDLETTIKERGYELLRIVNTIFDAKNAQNGQKFTENYNHIIEIIKIRYNIEF